MGPVDFVRGMEEALIRVCAGFGVMAGRVPGLTGVWCGSAGNRKQGTGNEEQGLGTAKSASDVERKIGAIGIHVAKGITSHGFALNVSTDLRDFELIVPCGIPDHAVTSLQVEMKNPEAILALETVAHQAARQFGMVFDEHVLAVESLDALRALAAPAERQFPAQDTPLRAPTEVERLQGLGERPVQA